MIETRYFKKTMIDGEIYTEKLTKDAFERELKVLQLRYKNVPYYEFETGSREYFTAQGSGLSFYTIDTEKRHSVNYAEYSDNKIFFKVQSIRKDWNANEQ